MTMDDEAGTGSYVAVAAAASRSRCQCRRLAAVDDDPDVGECLEDDGVVARRVEGKVGAQQALHVRGTEQLPPHDHLHHGRPEVGVRVPRALHHREPPAHLLLRRRHHGAEPVAHAARVAAARRAPVMAPGAGGGMDLALAAMARFRRRRRSRRLRRLATAGGRCRGFGLRRSRRFLLLLLGVELGGVGGEAPRRGEEGLRRFAGQPLAAAHAAAGEVVLGVAAEDVGVGVLVGAAEAVGVGEQLHPDHRLVVLPAAETMVVARALLLLVLAPLRHRCRRRRVDGEAGGPRRVPVEAAVVEAVDGGGEGLGAADEVAPRGGEERVPVVVARDGGSGQQRAAGGARGGRRGRRRWRRLGRGSGPRAGGRRGGAGGRAGGGVAGGAEQRARAEHPGQAVPEPAAAPPAAAVVHCRRRCCWLGAAVVWWWFCEQWSVEHRGPGCECGSGVVVIYSGKRAREPQWRRAF